MKEGNTCPVKLTAHICFTDINAFMSLSYTFLYLPGNQSQKKLSSLFFGHARYYCMTLCVLCVHVFITPSINEVSF